MSGVLKPAHVHEEDPAGGAGGEADLRGELVGDAGDELERQVREVVPLTGERQEPGLLSGQLSPALA
jgi:hypothetical protein